MHAVTLLCKNGTKLGFWSPDIVRRLLKLALDVLSLHKGKGTGDDIALYFESMSMATSRTISVADKERENLSMILKGNTKRFEELGMKNDLETLSKLLRDLIDISRCWFRTSRQILERALRVWFKRMSLHCSDAKEPDYAMFKNTIIDLGRNGLPEKNKLRLLDIVYATNHSYHPAQDGKSHLMPASKPGERRYIVANYTLKNGTLLLKYARKELQEALRSPMYWNHIWERYFPLSK